MIKKLFIAFFLFIFILLNITYKKLVFNSDSFDFLGFSGHYSKYVPNNYIKYFFVKDDNPVYVWGNGVFKSYVDDCHEKKENCIFMPHQQFYADLLWLGNIQYIGSVVDSQKAKYLYNLLDNQTYLSPYWDYPYIFGELLIPGSKFYLNKSDMAPIMTTWNNAINIGEKAKKYNCDTNKLSNINKLSGVNYPIVFQQKDSNTGTNSYINPCDTSEFASSLGFNYFYYLNKFDDSSKNYMISSFNDDSSPVDSSMVAIVQGRGGSHDKSMKIWFSKMMSISDKLATIKDNDQIDIYLGQLDQATKKALLELQFSILQKSSDKSSDDSACWHDYSCLLKKGTISFIVNDLINQCKAANLSNEDIKSLGTRVLSNDKLSMIMQCSVLSFGLQNKFILLDGELNHALQEQVKGIKLTFKWDNEMNDWWVDSQSVN